MAKRRQVSGVVQCCSVNTAEKETEMGGLERGDGESRKGDGDTQRGSKRDSDVSLHFDSIKPVAIDEELFSFSLSCTCNVFIAFIRCLFFVCLCFPRVYIRLVSEVPASKWHAISVPDNFHYFS